MEKAVGPSRGAESHSPDPACTPARLAEHSCCFLRTFSTLMRFPQLRFWREAQQGHGQVLGHTTMLTLCENSPVIWGIPGKGDGDTSPGGKGCLALPALHAGGGLPRSRGLRTPPCHLVPLPAVSVYKQHTHIGTRRAQFPSPEPVHR